MHAYNFATHMHTYNFGVSGRIPHEILPGDMAHSWGDNVDTNFTRGAPHKKFVRAKNAQNSARFSTFDFDREYLVLKFGLQGVLSPQIFTPYNPLKCISTLD